jgi:hypothetical protein
MVAIRTQFKLLRRDRENQMTQPFLKLSRALIAGLALLVAAPAFAGTMLFAEVLTSNQSLFLPQNVRATVEAGYINADPYDIMMQGDITPGAGIGDGSLSSTGDYVLFTHRFTPSTAYTAVTKAHLFIGVRDNRLFDGRESVDISLNQDFWQGGSAWLTLFDGEVTALFSNQEDELTVAVVSRRGSSIVDFSGLIWEYTTDDDVRPGTQPVPEPTGLALFCVGAVVLRRATRREG